MMSVIWSTFNQIGTISNILFSFLPQLSAYDVAKKLKEFGAIEEVTGDWNELTFTMVTTETIDKLKPHYKLVVNDVTLTLVFESDQTRRREDHNRIIPISPLLMKPPKDTEPNILDMLNDDCLEVIFRQSVLKIDDIISLAQTCSRFNQLALTIVDRSHQRERRRKYFSADCLEFKFRPLWQIENYLMEFGEFIKVVGSGFISRRAQIISGMVKDYCENLEQLVLFSNINEPREVSITYNR